MRRASLLLGTLAVAIPLAALATDKIRVESNEDLRVYDYFFEDLFRQKEFSLTPKEESLLALTGSLRQTPTNIYNAMTVVDMDFPRGRISLSRSEEGPHGDQTRQ